MNASYARLPLGPIIGGLTRSTPRILLSGNHQPSLLRHLEGWPRRNGKSRALLIRFADTDESLAGFADDSFDLAVIQAPPSECLESCVHELTRVARQGLITRR
ncbi:hypothetical protein [Pseudomonas saudiphocaensis]|uniref:Class I SAM-dependent methyltransferase n=1 Tax=Pseudomonas saudiphocaensis TaxID=1499686 RepID=A0A078LRR9_9PSED|nr:hypothetical protein [Pseudomonas saudiphocaensis]CDZ93794.1 hypothetical protein BN1079_01096 [Pseudomonas saudiphocaensis]